jgi:hypothetical protein
MDNLTVKNNVDIARIIASVRALSDNQVLVGVPSTMVGRQGSPASNAVIAYIHEHGSPSQNIPPRPFLEPGVRNAEAVIITRLRQSAQLAMKGNHDAVIRSLHALGLVVVSSIRTKISTGPFLPLAPATLAERRRRGVLRTAPLVDTGTLRRSISYVLRGSWF